MSPSQVRLPMRGIDALNGGYRSFYHDHANVNACCCIDLMPRSNASAGIHTEQTHMVMPVVFSLIWGLLLILLTIWQSVFNPNICHSDLAQATAEVFLLHKKVGL
jgi:hypothetical protein